MCFAAMGSGTQMQAAERKLLVISVDGLDWRYLRDADRLGLAIPNLRHLMKAGDVANGVVGVWPTITWPSHTTLITGARPDQHGILNNRLPKAQGGDYPWSPDFLKCETLWQAAGKAGLTTAVITWPVTRDAKITYDLPEFFARRNGGAMDLLSISSHSSPPGLADEIARKYPSFPQQWMDDRARSLATLYLLGEKRPDLLLVHFVDLDAEAHEQGPFEKNANAVLERTDELLGDILTKLPKQYILALVSDHGFERVDHIAHLEVPLLAADIAGNVQSLGGIAVTADSDAARFLRDEKSRAEHAIGREIPHEELVRYAPALAKPGVTAFEPAEHVMFFPGKQGDAFFTTPAERGNHGFWPARRDYRSVYLLYGAGVKAGREPEMQMTDIAGRLASILGIRLPAPK